MEKEFDVNMIIDTKLDNYDVEFHNVESEPFRIYGMWRDGDRFYRIPMSVAEATNEGVARKAATTAGGRVRFVTDSSFIAVKAEYQQTTRVDVTPITATLGFDVYADGKYAATYRVPQDTETELVGVREIGDMGERVITVNLPTHSSLKKLYVGVAKGATLKRAPDYKYEKPVVFYGSSIVNGSCASRPGMIYENQISRMLDTNYHNLGFGGAAKGEPAIAEYISGLDMSVFVLDYDHNAPTPEYLEETHEPFFKTVRAKNPDLPIVMISRPSGFKAEDTLKRFEIIKRTYENAVAAGDKNVYLINGLEFFGELANECTVDGIHPTDFGFYMMSKRISQVLAPLI